MRARFVAHQFLFYFFETYASSLLKRPWPVADDMITPREKRMETSSIRVSYLEQHRPVAHLLLMTIGSWVRIPMKSHKKLRFSPYTTPSSTGER